MSKKKGKRCNCGGWVTSPRRGISVEQSFENHLRSCPSTTRANQQPKE